MDGELMFLKEGRWKRRVACVFFRHSEHPRSAEKRSTPLLALSPSLFSRQKPSLPPGVLFQLVRSCKNTDLIVRSLDFVVVFARLRRCFMSGDRRRATSASYYKRAAQPLVSRDQHIKVLLPSSPPPSHPIHRARAGRTTQRKADADSFSLSFLLP